VLVLANLGAAVTQAVVATLLLSGGYHLGAVVVLEALNGTFTAFTMPALRGVVPQLVERVDLQRANSLLATSRNATRVLGPAVAGVVVATVGGGWAIAADAAGFAVAAACMSRLRLPAPAAGFGSGVLADVRAGWHEFRALPWVMIVVASFTGSNFVLAGVWLVLGPTISRATIGEAAWGLAVSARAVGMVVMSVLMYRLVVVHLLRLGQASAALFGMPMIVLGLGLPAGWLIAAAFVSGLGLAVTGVAWETSLQEHVPAHALSRVASYDSLGSFAAVPIGQLAVVPIAAAVGDHRVAVAGGILYAVLALAALAARPVRNLRHVQH
jgi:hypothetical protein